MTFSVRHLLRQIPAESLRSYFESRRAAVPADWWKDTHARLAGELAKFLFRTSNHAGEIILSELVRVQSMGSERGRIALLNAGSGVEGVTVKFGELDNDEERALWMLSQHPEIFREGEELLFFDHYSEGGRSQHYTTSAGLTVSQDGEDTGAFKSDVCQFYRRRDGSGISCEVEFAERHLEGSTQIAIYIQGLPDNSAEFVDGKFKRRISNPALQAAIVYNPNDGHTATVAKGGRPVHEALREAFARRLLKIEPTFDLVRKRPFRLDVLKSAQSLVADPALGVHAVRVRKLKLAPPAMGTGMLTIEAPSGKPDTSVYDLGNRWFSEQSRVYRKFTVVHATISMHFAVPPGSKRGKTLNIELTRPNASNLKSFSDKDRKIAEAHIAKWQLIEPVV